MKKLFVALGSLSLCACASLVAYAPKQMSREKAQSIIEQVLMEEPLKFRPESVEFTPEYVAIYQGYGAKSGGAAVVLPNTPVVLSGNRSSSKQISTRIYYSSINEILLYRDNNHYAMRPMTKEGRVIHTAVTMSEEKARQYVDALHSLRPAE